MILVFLIIILIGLSVLKQVWRKSNGSMNFRGGKMLNVNSVIVRGVRYLEPESKVRQFLCKLKGKSNYKPLSKSKRKE